MAASMMLIESKSLVERFGFEESDITILIDTDRRYTQPTGANIKRALNKLVTESQAGDVLFFHYSGHGVRLPAETGENDDTGYDECIVPCDFNLINDDDFRELVDKVPQGVTMTLICDSCHSGGLINNAKEQIGESSQQGGSKASEGGGFREGLRSFVSDKIHGALEERGIDLHRFDYSSRHHRHSAEDEHFRQVPYEGEGHVKSRALPLSTFLEILKQKTGKDDLDVGNIRPTLFDMFGQDSSSKVKKFVKVLFQSMHHDEDDDGEDSGSGHHHHHGLVNALAQQFMKHKLDQVDNADEYLKPAMEMPISGHEEAFAGANERTFKDRGVLISGCQSNETSADANPTGKASEAYGAMSNALQTILSEADGPITNHQLVTRVRQILKKQGFSQHPGLYCSDHHATQAFVC